ncbi:hypothetical protein ACFQX4_21105 [Roseomonas sp. GCM10028921]
MSETSKLINDLKSVPDIVAGLGLGIAEAQKALNLSYLESLRTLVGLAQQLMGQQEGGTADEALARARTIMEQTLGQLAPPRYQFTETTLTVRLDLSQTMRGAAQAGIGGVGAVVVSASLAAAFGMDYRAAAELRTVLHAVPAGASVFKDLLGRVEELDAKQVALPPRSELDQKVMEVAGDLSKRLTGKDPPAIGAPGEGRAAPGGGQPASG